MKLFKQTPVALIVMAMCSSAFSQSAANSSTANDTVVISGSRSASKLSETAASIGLVTRAQWDEEKPKSVGDIINRIPGVFWNNLGNEQHSMSIRQPISTNAVYQYLEDGIPIRPLGVLSGPQSQDRLDVSLSCTQLLAAGRRCPGICNLYC